MVLKAMVLKRCQRCGWQGYVAPRQRRCYQRRFGKGSYCCWGDLQRPSKPVAAPQVVKEEVPVAKESRRDTAERNLKAARQHMAEASTRIRRATTSLKLWEKRATYYARIASMTDAEIEAERATKRTAREARAQRDLPRAVDLRRDGGAV